MQVPFESRVLLALASALVPRDLRADWRREWEAEIWWWMGSHPGERFQLAVHCAGALCDATYLRAGNGAALLTAKRLAGAPAVCLASLLALLFAVVLGSGLYETRRVLRGEPFPGNRLAVLSQVLPFMGAHFGVPPSKVAEWNARAATLEGAAVYARNRFRNSVIAGPNFFTLLGNRAAVGSLNSTHPLAAVISYDLWQRRFHGDPAIVSQTLDSVPIIGVLPRDFWFLDLHPDIWFLGPPLGDAPSSAVARLKPGVTPAEAQAELRQLAAPVRGSSRGSAVVVEPIGQLSDRPLTTLGLPWLVLVLAAVAASVTYFRRTPRFALFLAAKAVLALTLVLLITVEFGSSWMTIGSGESNLAAGVASLWIFLAGPAAALYWCWRDQRQRCRTCLHRLAMPVSFGSGARLLLERTGTELVCPQGHGTLFTAGGADPAVQWDPMDSSWRELFVSK